MKMSDNDFDQLFNAKLSGMEMEPSARVWGNIANEIDGKKKKQKNNLSFLQIAAGLVLLMVFGLYFIKPSGGRIALRGVGPAQQAVNQNQSSPAYMASANTGNTNAVNPAGVIGKIKFQRYKVVPMVFEKPSVRQTQEVPVIANLTTYHQPGEADLIVVSTSLTPASDTENAGRVETEGALKANVLAQNTPAIKEPAKKKQIHTLGDLLNVVIAKVDKREDKLIQFTNSSDDDGFSITGINLGIISTKKEK